MSDSSFLSRWSRRKTAVRRGVAIAPEPAQAVESVPVAPSATPEPAQPLPTLADAALLKPGDSVARFVARGVDESVKRSALKTLFADPHFNVMDGLDVYIDDYSKPDPIPLAVLRRLRQSQTLGLFEPTDEEAEAARVRAGQEQAQAATESGAPAAAATGDAAAARADAAPSTESGGDAAATDTASPVPSPEKRA